ncbi:MAG: hypothetical protein SF182_27165 [Deltaproteobacteria bacterium]|nr:hypothetical protein [Deltaproteobacteria bacterium]
MSRAASDSIAAPAPVRRVGDDPAAPASAAPAQRMARTRRWAWRRLRGDLWDDVGSLTVIVPLPHDAERVRQLTTTLEAVDADIRAQRSPLREVRGLHVARWVVLPERVRGRGALTQPSLVMWVVHDGDRAAHLRELTHKARSVLDQVYAHCDGYPGAGAPGAAVARFLTDHEAHGRVASYVGTPGVSVDSIRLQRRLVEEELVPLARELRMQQLPNHHVFLAMQDFVTGRSARPFKDPALREFASRRPGTRKLPWLYLDLIWNLLRSRNTLRAVVVLGTALTAFANWWHLDTGFAGGLAFVAVGAAGLAALALTVFGFGLRNAEKREAMRYIRASDRELRDHDDRLARRDNEGPGMNRVTIVTDLKPGLTRQITLRFVLWLVAFRAGRNFEGSLEGIETIHFAQWRIVDGGRRLLFMSNYDGQALDYFREFAENSAPGVNAIWGNTEGMPNTTAVIGEGSRNLEEFQNAARVHQIPTDAWYCGYADRRFLTVAINDNWRIHRLLHEHPTPSQVDEWMTLLERYGV